MCPPCKTRFNYIVKVETMNEDVRAIFRNNTHLFVEGTISVIKYLIFVVHE